MRVPPGWNDFHGHRKHTQHTMSSSAPVHAKNKHSDEMAEAHDTWVDIQRWEVPTAAIHDVLGRIFLPPLSLAYGYVLSTVENLFHVSEDVSFEMKEALAELS